ncbi:hypothetical protein HanXRQr2_Chr10g0424391 [Helianthus annuus]|uniref:Uncharacterized protein n=1 Tax=Helianthus annuus TaxID=4232 RepID=A0A251TH85_HELAN|nr:uncharacterized protein LOC110884126 [Helianthus annuus]KAF5785082.1 hypothetical protein HanXRQr2_Chr10g0424391 [Helianthus annuus]KAJ0512679.1 putative mad1/Cdc20-bound-Mad2 binding protein [Helianthus annuus]KAJ0528808.1 putative mad1/Cdc20-bound-Mad2 binding protein [Helianthus annuus]KAJ0695721.1 putative mad1/Cdc20-bound-Mad2 binding protein [Helianthus annuus]
MAIDREAMKEGGGISEMEFKDLELPADSIDASVMFHLVMDVLGFVLFMHQQIPSILQDLSLEFDDMNTEYKDLEVAIANSEMKASQRRIQMGRKRQVKHVIRRLEKLMKTVADTQTALQLVFSDIPHVEAVILVLGASPVRPRRVYEFCFSHGKDVSDACDFTKTRVAEAFSKKVIRTLVAKGAGSESYAGPSKLFLLVKAPSSFNMPLHFLPKRDFRCNKKIVPMRLRIKCRNQDRAVHSLNCDPQPANPSNMLDSTSNEYIWFQCRHVIKGLAWKSSAEE